MKKIENIYFIGVGGVGMSGIALVASAQGLYVEGSDIRKSYMTDLLEKNGIKVNIGQIANNISNAKVKPDVVVVSTAIMQNNPELSAAKDAGIEIWHRAKMLSFLGRDLETLAVAGTHGKTSTSSMLASALSKMDEDPTFLIGGVVSEFKTNARFGEGEYYVVEADESDKSFKYIKPASAIITNIEADHLDHYKDLDEIYEKFGNFISSIDDDGYAVVCGDDEELVKLANNCNKKVVTYGFSKKCDYVVKHYSSKGLKCSFDVCHGRRKYHVDLNHTPGKHYASNACGVLALIDVNGLDVSVAADNLCDFRGIKRRFEYIGKETDITVCDDYAHHPTEIAATINAATSLGFNNVHVIWQPHRYSRVKLICDVYPDIFARAFDGCASVTFTDVYAAGEAPVAGVSGKTFLDVVAKGQTDDRAAMAEKLPELHYVEKVNEIPAHIKNIAKPGDLVITMGAGDITAQAPRILKCFSK